MLVDTSVWITVLRDKTGQAARVLRSLLGATAPVLPRFTQLELLQGARDEAEWQLLLSYLDAQTYAEPRQTTWRAAARIYFDLRRQGITIRSPIDCCIAQLALDADLELMHRDSDFENIALVRPLKHHYLTFEI